MAYALTGNAAPIAKKPKENPFGPDILHTLLDQTEEAAMGMLTAPWYIGKTAFADVKNVFDGSGDFATDDLIADIAKTTVRDVKRRWEPLINGEFTKFWDGVEKDPLGTILDVATLATGGGAAAAKAGKAAALAGDTASMWTKAAGLRKSDLTLDDLAMKIAHDRKLDLDTLDDADFNLFRSLAKQKVKLDRGVVDVDGNVWDGPVAHLNAGNERVALPLSNNPIIRSRQAATAKLSNKFENAPGIGSAGRATRAKVREDRRLVDRETLRVTAPAEAALRGLDDTENAALSIMPWREAGMSREAVRAFWNDKLENAKQAAEEAWVRAEKNDRYTKSARAADLRAQTITERLAAVDDDAIWNAADPAQMSDQMRIAADELVNVSKNSTYEIWNQAGGKTRNGTPIDFEDFWALQRSREARRMMRGDGPDELDLLGDDELDITAAELADQWKNLKYSYVRPHTKVKDYRAYGRQGVTYAGGEPVAKDSARSMRNSFTTFDDAMDVFDPRSVLEGARQVAQYRSTVRRMDFLRETGQSFQSEADVPEGWKILSRDGKLNKDLADLEEWLNEDGIVVFGREAALDETLGVIKKYREAVDDRIFAAPTAVANEMLAEFKQMNSFIKKYDSATDKWRTMTLTLRPVWITGNLIGQMALLITTHGFIKGGMNYLQAARMGAGHILDKTAPDVAAAGLVRDALQEAGRDAAKGSLVSVAARKAMGQKGARARQTLSDIWGSTEKITQFNAWLTDDIPRRAAFMSEIKGPVKQIQAETGLDFEDAALQYLSDPEVVDAIAAKVTSDLVDFRSLTEFEKKYLRRAMPFWSWIRGATGRTWRLALDEPWKVWLGVNAAQWGIEQNEDQFGDLPDFLVGMLPVGESGDEQQRVITSQSINPFSTFGDITGMLKSLTVGDVQVGGSNPMATFNPFLKGAIEAFTNRDLYYGTPLDYGADAENEPGFQPSDLLPPGYMGRLAERFGSSFPQQRLYEKLTQSGDQGTSTLYENSDLDALLSYFALPTRQLNVSEANERAKAQKEGAQYGVI